MSKIKTQHIIQISLLFSAIAIVVFGKNFIPKTISSDTAVLSSNIQAQNIETDCQRNSSSFGNKETCYSHAFNLLAEKSGPTVSFQVLKNLQKIDPDAIGCHLISHGIGIGSYKRDPGSWQELIQTMSPSCNYGAIHGVLEAYVESLPDRKLTSEIIPKICGVNPRADCNHIVGHLILVFTNADMKKGLDSCDVFMDYRQRDFCQTGVFMEEQTALNLIDHGLAPKSWLNWQLRLPDLEKICRSYGGDKLSDDKASACWQEIVHVALVAFHNDAEKTFQFCDTAQVLDGAKRCKRHALGIIGATKNFDLSKLKYICQIPQKNDPDFEGECYPNLVSSSLSTIPDAIDPAINFCSSIEDKFKGPCFSMIGAVSSHGPVSKDSLRLACEKAPKEFQDFCFGSYQGGNVGENKYGKTND
ncbi:hypothetical protein H0W91_02100 [Patescibacteria group bacterium]|nr:hypothetical protein [Patescibacteria group bacterium]